MSVPRTTKDGMQKNMIGHVLFIVGGTVISALVIRQPLVPRSSSSSSASSTDPGPRSSSTGRLSQSPSGRGPRNSFVEVDADAPISTENFQDVGLIPPSHGHVDSSEGPSSSSSGGSSSPPDVVSDDFDVLVTSNPSSSSHNPRARPPGVVEARTMPADATTQLQDKTKRAIPNPLTFLCPRACRSPFVRQGKGSAGQKLAHGDMCEKFATREYKRRNKKTKKLGVHYCLKMHTPGGKSCLHCKV